MTDYGEMDHAGLREAADARGLNVPDDASEDDLRNALRDSDTAGAPSTSLNASQPGDTTGVGSIDQEAVGQPTEGGTDVSTPPTGDVGPGEGIPTSDSNVERGAASPANVQAGMLADAGQGQTMGTQDPALTDPEGAARARVEGRTSDATLRTADARASDVAPDINETAKPSDGGPDAYPFPTGGDVEITTIPSGDGQNEFMAPLEVEDWVILDGSHELVPDRLDGRYAAVLDAPRIQCNCDWAPTTHEHTHPDAGITVRTRDEVNALLVLPMDAFKAVGRGGRSALLPIG